jgi:anti-sigma factor RsiW
MNCKHVQELLPLYVGRDLEEKRAQQVTAHVQSCAECASCADEYRETRQLLQQFAPPPFSDAMYAGIRQRVLREIERESTAPTLAQLFASVFRPRLRWAVATALLLAVSVFAFYFVAHRRTGQQQEGQQLAANRGTGSQSDHLARAVRAGLTGTAGSPPAFATSSRKPRLILPAQRVGHSKWAGGAPAVPVRSTSYSSVETKDPSLNPSATSEKTLRVEMQTKDRNIRIIWFSHQRTKQESPSKSSDSI